MTAGRLFQRPSSLANSHTAQSSSLDANHPSPRFDIGPASLSHIKKSHYATACQYHTSTEYGVLYGSLHVCSTPDSRVMAVGIRRLLINLSRRGSSSVGHAGHAAAISFMSVVQTIRPSRPGTAFSASCLYAVHVTNGRRGALRHSKRQSTSSSGEE